MPIIRLKKGAKVEVWNTTKVPSGSWRCAEIVSGNGHTYSVRYNGSPNDSTLTMERVPRKHIRPCPPPFRGLKGLKIGETIEVFDNNTWKFAKLLMIFYDDYCFVMLIGSSRKFRTHKSHVRRQLSWQNNKWVVIDQVSGEQNGGMMSGAVRQDKYSSHTQLCEEMQNFAGKNHFPEVLRSGKKRPHDVSIPNSICNNDSRIKMRAIKKDVRDQRIATKHQIQHLKKSDSLVPVTRMFGENCMDGQLNDRTVGSFKMEMGRGIASSRKQRYLPRNVEMCAECTSLSSSVGSCSVDSPCTSSKQQHVANSPQELHRHSDHDESNGSERDYLSLPRKDLKAQIHHLELHAYRSTLKAFYASGPVSWERESVMTSLRTALNISVDEHLLELKKLVHSDLANTCSQLSSRYA